MKCVYFAHKTTHGQQHMDKSNVSILEIHEHDSRFMEAEHGKMQFDQSGVFICKAGTLTLSIDDKVYHLERNSMIVYFANSTLHVVDKSADLHGFVLSAYLEALQPVLYNVTNFSAIFVLMQSPLQVITDEELDVIERYTSLLHIAMKKKAEQDDKRNLHTPMAEMATRQVNMICSSLVLEILQCYTCTAECYEPMSRKEDILKQFLTLLYKDYRKEHKINYYADRLFLTPRYFSMVIKEQSGKSPLSWITSALYIDARNMLQDTNYSIKEIADTLNFPTQSYFGKWFKNITGVNPLDFRHKKGGAKQPEEELTSFIEKNIGLHK